MRCAVTSTVCLLAACSAQATLDLPGDPASRGVPVGVQTIVVGEHTVEVWYPADDATDTTGASDDVVSLADVVTPAFKDALGDTVAYPTFTQPAVRDAVPRPLASALPVIVFSHGFGGFRTQSATLTAHLASRGYIVVATDHPGRTLADVAPCLLNPPPGPCTFGFNPDAEDPAVADIADVLAWLEDGPDTDFADLLDLTHLGIWGHSAGGVTTTDVANADTRFQAALAMAGGTALTRQVDSAVLAGSCDGIVPATGLTDLDATTTDGTWLLQGAGHLAFSDLCAVDLGGLADQIALRDDANGLVIAGLRRLATDGCPGATPVIAGCETFVDPSVSDPLIRAASTTFFDATLRDGEGRLDGLASDVFVRAGG
ncbi:MAG: prolyl oligopeptidase family serine peptidase [Alphaproteobacteria bacterium]|nr:prolyl oligopeptidase family serine peptidase [Alphaproteobacteria bacterium]